MGFAVAGGAGVVLCAAIATGGDIIASRWDHLARLGAWSAVWVVAVLCALRLPRRTALAGIFVVAVALRLAALAGPPVLSDDFYRYAWDGRVQAAGVDPYRHPPTSARLTTLRERWLWPDDAGCARLGREPGCTLINRPTVRTIYPPLAQAWFATVYRVTGIGAHHKPWQVAGLLVDLVLVGLLPRTLRAWGRDERWTALYALSPFPVLEVVNNGHVDGLAALFLVAALLALARRRPGWAGALIGAAVLVKLYPALLLVAVAGAAVGARRRLPDLVRASAAAAAVVVAGYLPHVLAVGVRVVGYLPGYLREEHYDSGGRFLLAALVRPPGVPAAAVAGAGVVVAIGWVVLRRPPAPRACAGLLGVLLLATTPVQPWYAVTLLAVATVAAAPAWSLVAAAAYPYFFAVILASPHTVAIGRLAYGLALAGAAAAALATHRRRAAHPTASATAGGPGPGALAAGATAGEPAPDAVDAGGAGAPGPDALDAGATAGEPAPDAVDAGGAGDPGPGALAAGAAAREPVGADAPGPAPAAGDPGPAADQARGPAAGDPAAAAGDPGPAADQARGPAAHEPGPAGAPTAGGQPVEGGRRRWGRGAVVGAAGLAVLLVGPALGAVRPERSITIPPLPVLGPSRDAYDGDLGDPFVLPVTDAGFDHPNRFVAFGTGDWPARVPTASTPDLHAWQAGPDALPDLPPWAAADPRNSHSWAPAVLAVEGRYVLYITVPEQGSGLQCIAAATSPTPEGPYRDPGPGPLVCQRELGGSIDPSVVADHEGGLHLLWKNDGNCCGSPAGLWEQALTADGIHVTGPAHRLLTAGAPWQGDIVENPAAIAATGGGWWLFYSANQFDVVDYATGVAWCATLEGPCQEAQPGPFLATEGTRYAPGGLETFRDGQGDLWAVYDTWNRPARNGRFRCCRSLYLARVLSS